MNALTCGVFFAIFILISAFSLESFEKWSEKKNKWKNDYNHNEKYMECLIMEWLSFMLFISCGIVSFIYAFAFFTFLL